MYVHRRKLLLVVQGYLVMWHRGGGAVPRSKTDKQELWRGREEAPEASASRRIWKWMLAFVEAPVKKSPVF